MNLSFAPLPNDDPRGDNAVMANFRDENLSLTDIFIREFLQNVLDNRVELEDGKHQIANIVINICEIENSSNKQFINHIFDHSTLSSINSLEDINFEPGSLRALIIEENNTKGITGRRDSSDDQGNWAKFWHAQSSYLAPILIYFNALLQTTKLNAIESVELARPVIAQNKLNLIENWIKEGKLTMTNELGDLIRAANPQLALNIYQ